MTEAKRAVDARAKLDFRPSAEEKGRNAWVAERLDQQQQQGSKGLLREVGYPKPEGEEDDDDGHEDSDG